MEDGGEHKPAGFFYRYLMFSPVEDIIEYLDRLDRECKQIEDEVMSIALYGLGGFTWSDAWTLSADYRNRISKKITEYYKKRAGDDREFL